jgi:single-strand DNA-binding protein
MAMLNDCNFIGRVGKQPVAQKSQEGKPYLRFTLYVDQGKDQKGAEKEAMKLTIVCFGKLAEIMAEKLFQGQQVYVKSRVQVSTYIGGDGMERVSVAFHAVDIQLLDKKAKDGTEVAK